MATTASTTRTRKTAARAVAKEAVSDGTLTFVYAGEKYTVPEEGVRDIEFLEAYEDRKLITAVRHLLGPDQWETFKAHKKPVLDQDFIALANEMFEALGANQEK